MDMDKVTADEAAQNDIVSLISRCEWQAVINRLKESPHQAMKKQVITLDGVETSSYPLHLSVSKKPPLHVVETLIEGYPDAIKAREETSGRLPLHIACIHTASGSVLRLLTEKYEESLRITDTVYGRLPLHFACLYGSPFDISLIVSAEPRALVFKDANGKTPKDLAEESSNPHREAIVARLEDRTRLVTETLIQRRKQMASSPQETVKRKSSFRRNSHDTSAALIPSEESSSGHRANRRAKSSGVSDMTAQRVNTERTKSMSLAGPLFSEKARRKSSKTFEKIDRFSTSRTKDDSYIVKSTRPSRRNRHENKVTTSTQEIHSPILDPKSGRRSAKADVEKTPVMTNRNSLTASLEEASNAVSSPQGLGHTRSDHGQATKLSRFLQLEAANSSDDESEVRSIGVRSLPALMHSAFSKQPALKMPGNNQVIKEFMFQDSSDDMDSPLPTDDEVTPACYEMVAINERLRNLDIRREALSYECEAINTTIAKKGEAVQSSRKIINDIKQQILELQEKLDHEQTSLSLSETGVQLQKETLAVHEIKIRGVDSEREMVIAQKQKLEEKTRGNTTIP